MCIWDRCTMWYLISLKLEQSWYWKYMINRGYILSWNSVLKVSQNTGNFRWQLETVVAVRWCLDWQILSSDLGWEMGHWHLSPAHRFSDSQSNIDFMTTKNSLWIVLSIKQLKKKKELKLNFVQYLYHTCIYSYKQTNTAVLVYAFLQGLPMHSCIILQDVVLCTLHRVRNLRCGNIYLPHER